MGEPRERFCFNCGDSLGVSTYHEPLDNCGKVECARAARNAYQADLEERRMNAELDDYSRY